MVETTVPTKNPVDEAGVDAGLHFSLDHARDIAMISVARANGSVTDQDLTLVRRCKRGDTEAYRQLVARHERRVLSILTRIMFGQRSAGPCHCMADVEDLAQEVFVQAWRAIPSFRGDAQFSTWLYRIATNRALKEWRRSKRAPGDGWAEGELDDERWADSGGVAEPHSSNADPETVAQISARNEQLKGAIETLPEKQRLVVLLHYYDDYACEEIAQILECSVGTVWSRLHYACRRLRDLLKLAEVGSV